MATTVVRNLVVKLSGKAASYTKMMRNAIKQQQAFKKISDKLSASANKFAKRLTALLDPFTLVTAAAVAASVAFFQTAKSIDEVAKTSQRLGIATENLVGLEVAASRTGVGVKQLRLGLQRMTRRVAEAAKGTGEAKDTLRELGLDARKLSQQSPDEVFAAIAEATKDITNQSDRVRIFFKIFDSEGVGLVNTAAGGAEALRKFNQEARDLGLIFSKEEATRLEKFNDSFAGLFDRIKGAGRQFTIDIAPAALRAIEALDRILREATRPLREQRRLEEALDSFRRGLSPLTREPLTGAKREAELERQRSIRVAGNKRGLQALQNLIPGVSTGTQVDLIRAQGSLARVGRGLGRFFGGGSGSLPLGVAGPEITNRQQLQRTRDQIAQLEGDLDRRTFRGIRGERARSSITSNIETLRKREDKLQKKIEQNTERSRDELQKVGNGIGELVALTKQILNRQVVGLPTADFR